MEKVYKISEMYNNSSDKLKMTATKVFPNLFSFDGEKIEYVDEKFTHLFNFPELTEYFKNYLNYEREKSI